MSARKKGDRSQRPRGAGRPPKHTYHPDEILTSVKRTLVPKPSYSSKRKWNNPDLALVMRIRGSFPSEVEVLHPDPLSLGQLEDGIPGINTSATANHSKIHTFADIHLAYVGREHPISPRPGDGRRDGLMERPMLVLNRNIFVYFEEDNLAGYGGLCDANQYFSTPRGNGPQPNPFQQRFTYPAQVNISNSCSINPAQNANVNFPTLAHGVLEGIPYYHPGCDTFPCYPPRRDILLRNTTRAPALATLVDPNPVWFTFRWGPAAAPLETHTIVENGTRKNGLSVG
ncbi:hypothetical protein GQ43DRAFT_318054 [Delitschia confertaspora ATCC 74209]|uniref:Uncharacterized protein n=1 Tax=Delitschia confertaspora ATCC 74209 TaxID=1513339 RepID=A0A9P4JPZ9_9PLEO|nr:hypothetical protein GQ43DRAFT_318054 [Delitschia confertaspora ATCC 74209]